MSPSLPLGGISPNFTEILLCDRWKSVVVCGQHLHQRTFPKLLAGFWPNLAGMIFI